MTLHRLRSRIVLSVLVGLFLLTSSAKALAFNWDTDNAPVWLIAPYEIPAIYGISAGANDASIVLRITTLLANAWFDAIAPYHPTAVGVYSRIPRRPPSEGRTNRNKNIALMYASYRVLNSLVPQNGANWREMMTSAGLNPDDASTDTTHAVGIGNVAGNAIVAARLRDGMNQLGDEGGSTYHLKPYADYTRYQPVNTPSEVVDAGRWQPLVVTKGVGLFQAQQFVTPQWGITRPYTVPNVNKFVAPAPAASNPNSPAYKQQADAVLAAQAGLTNRQKALAELFDDKVVSLGVISGLINLSRGYDLTTYIYERFSTGIAIFDAGIATWKEKLRHDAVRPITAIRHLYGNQPVTAWGGPGKGTVNDLPASQWRGYLNTADHPEYPSGSACFCSAHAQAARRLESGSDRLGAWWFVAKGSSRVEPGVTPTEDTWLYWNTWTEFVEDCGKSRFYGGVHFLPAIEEAKKLCTPFGDLGYEFMINHINGTAREPNMSQAIR